MRFEVLKMTIGNISHKVLTEQLRDMEEKRLIIRTVYAEIPPRVEYSLSEIGYSLKPLLDSMIEWGNTYKTKKDL